jgi:SynChlorMet cassette radical SAM/SPASM protein ScmE
VGNDLPAHEWLSFFEELNRAAVIDVTLEGGEVFCRPDLHELLEGVVRNRLRFTILTNGTLITEDIAGFIAGTRRCNTVQVSIDGSVADTHDAARGKGNFLRTMKGIDILRRYNIPLSVRVTINRYNVGDLAHIAKLLLEDLGLPSFSTNAASYQGLCRANSGEVQLSVQERSFAMKELLRLNTRYGGRINAAAGPLSEAVAWLEMVRFRREGKQEIPNRGRLVSCGGVFVKCGVRPDGVIVPCVQMSHIELGSINRDDFVRLWQEHPQLQRLRERRSIPLSEFVFCRGCDFIAYCAGSCPALAYTIVGDEFHPSPDACLKRFLEAGGELPYEQLLAA